MERNGFENSGRTASLEIIFLEVKMLFSMHMLIFLFNLSAVLIMEKCKSISASAFVRYAKKPELIERLILEQDISS